MLANCVSMLFVRTSLAKQLTTHPSLSRRHTATGQVRLAATSSAVSFLHCLRAGDENLRKQQEQQHHAALELARVQAHALTAGHSSVNGPDYEAVLRAAYTKFNPAKLTEVGTILEAFRGREKYMLEQLERKYGPIPMPWRSSGDVKGNVASTGGLTARATFQRMTQRDSSDLNGSGQTNSSSSDVTCVRWLQLYGNLVPRLCLNRFHPSHGTYNKLT